jgi:hypothetical protein
MEYNMKGKSKQPLFAKILDAIYGIRTYVNH